MVELTINNLIPSAHIISPILPVETPANTYIELLVSQLVARTSTPETEATNTQHEDPTLNQPKPKRKRRTKLEMIAARALEAEARTNNL